MKFRLLSLTALGLLTACQSQPPVDPALGKLTQAHLGLMRQQADELAGELRQLDETSRAYCAGEQPLATVQQQWRDAFAAWTAHQGQSGGPLDAAGLSYAFQLWPDKKDTTGRQLARQLNQPGPLKGASITLGAVEHLLYEDLSQTQRCTLLPRVNEQLVQNGERLQMAWYNPSDYEQQLEQMAIQGGDSVLLVQILGQLAHRFDRIEKKLDLPLNTVDHPRPLFAEAWRSEQSLHFVRTSLQSLEREYQDGGIRAYLQQKHDTTLITELDEAFADTLNHLPEGDSLTHWLRGDNYAALLRFKLSFDRLGSKLKLRLPDALGISLGFNATDGD
ncbi:imelysin family protein [Oceanimonas sp. CHS3-5]|uniref:imelysin family protein n=1 Tax=Oceanimonas sp. CHS3-5 TaxID=3068186 RepID=UPI00273E9378|nr:imelysin family protein [Oceanimonas sp. CHS3-5]MDP5293333.1 imelysin family protein [Oceanimonas sp. CHS3-5]